MATKNHDNAKEQKSILENLFSSSSVIGLPQITTSRSIIRKLLWCTVLIVGLTFCAIESNKFMTEFYKYPVTVDLEVENKGELEFPAITVCNINKVKKSMYHRIMGKINSTSTFVKTTVKINNKMITKLNMPAQCSSERHLKEQHQAEFYSNYYFLNKTIRAEIGHQKEDLISAYTMNGVALPNTFQQIVKPKFGACYIFNSRINSPSKYIAMSRSIGISNGFNMTINLELKEYLDDVITVGARIVIHSPEEYPDTEGEGINIPPGMETSISIKKKSIRRLPYPYKDKCKDYKAEAYANKNGPVILNQKDCRIFCLQKINMKRCGCTDPTLIFTAKRKCDLRITKKVCCLDSVFDKIIKEEFKRCNCPIECQTTSFQPTISMSDWYGHRSDEDIQIGHNHSEFRDNFAKVVIYYSTLEETIYVQRPAYENSEWYSHLGGQLGLWLGISLPAIFDCAESIIFLFYHACFAKCSSKKNTKNLKNK